MHKMHCGLWKVPTIHKNLTFVCCVCVCVFLKIDDDDNMGSTCLKKHNGYMCYMLYLVKWLYVKTKGSTSFSDFEK